MSARIYDLQAERARRVAAAEPPPNLLDIYAEFKAALEELRASVRELEKLGDALPSASDEP